jgi:hypothetical protein
MPKELIPGEKKTPVYKKQEFGEPKSPFTKTKTKTMSGPFKMKGSPMQRNFGIGSPLRANGDKDELVKHTSTEKPRDWGSTKVDPYEIKISKQTKRLIELGAPKSEIEKSKVKTIKAFKNNNIEEG